MQVLIIGYVWPEPRSSAAGSRMLSLIDAFRSQDWPVVFATPAVPTGHQADLGELGVDCRAITLNCDSFDAFIAQIRPDIVVFDRFMMEEQFGWRVAEVCPGALRVLNTEDLHSLRQTRQRRLQSLLCGNATSEQKNTEAEQDRDWAIADYMAASPGELFQWMAAEELAYREIAAIHRCDLTLMISEFEQALLVEQFGIAPGSLHYCPLMVPVSDRPLARFEGRAHFISIGNFRHAPNWDAVLWLKQRIWPAIRARLPSAELHLYGAYPPPKATALTSARDGFRVKGWAADAAEVLTGARVCLAPLRFGAGIKGKLVDAMAAGTPSVTTPLGAEAMAGPHPWPGGCESTAAGLVERAVTLYHDKEAWSAAQERGRAIVRERFRPETQVPALVARLRTAVKERESMRQRNFVGAMLRHHSHQSSHYLGRWIDAKNRLQRVSGT